VADLEMLKGVGMQCITPDVFIYRLAAKGWIST